MAGEGRRANLFSGPFRWEWTPEAGAGRPASECVVFDANDEVIAVCITDLHAAELCERLNQSEMRRIDTGTSSITSTSQPIEFIG